MHRFFLFLILLSFTIYAGNQKVNQFLHLGKIEIPTLKLENDYSSILEFQHFDKLNWYPAENQKFILNENQSLEWKKISDSQISLSNQSSKTRIDYIAFYVRTERFNQLTVNIETDGFTSLYIDNQLKESNKQNSKIDTISTKVNVEPGNKLFLIKVVTPSEKESNLSVNIESKFEIEVTTDNKRYTTVEDLLNNPKASGVDISFDGRYGIVKLNERSSDRKSSESSIEIYDLTQNKLITNFAGGMKLSSAEWLPNKNVISYQVSSSNSIWLYDFDSKTNKLFAENLENMSGYTWAPNGNYIIYSVTEKYKDDGSGLKKYTSINDRMTSNKNKSKLFKMDYPSGFKTEIQIDDDSPSLNSISSDGKFIIYSKSRVDLTERPFTKNSYYKLNLENMEEDSLFTLSWSGTAKISLDGNKILITAGPTAFNGIGLNMEKDLIANEYDTQAYIYDLKSEKVSALTKDFNPQINIAEWINDKEILFQVTEESYSKVYKYNLGNESFSLIPLLNEDIDKIDFSRDYSKALYTASSSNIPVKIYKFNAAENKSEVVSNIDQTYDNIELGEVKDWDFISSKGTKIKGRIYLPPNFDESKKYPVIVNYYGGTSPTTREFEGRYPKNIWAANGYLVYVLQPSGATGFGQTFSAYHVNDWGTTTADEIIEGTKKFLADHKFADPENVGCIGASYGGFMTMTLLTKTDIFSAAVSHAGISALTSYWGEGYWGYSYSAIATADSYPWNRKDIYVDKSPIYHADKIKTPLLLLHGASDTNVPIGESLTMFTALKLLGQNVEFVEVAGQDHWILDYDKRMKWTKTIIAYFDRFLKEQPEWWDNLYPEKLKD